MINARLQFIFFEDEINDIHTQWIEFDASMSVEEINTIFSQEWRHLLFDAIIAIGLNENHAKNLIDQICKRKGKVKIEIAPIDFKVD